MEGSAATAYFDVKGRIKGSAVIHAHLHQASANVADAGAITRGAAYPVASEEALIGRIADGDETAMRALFARHHVKVFRFVLGIVKDRTVAEDVVGEVFLDVWRHAARFEARSSVSTWLLAIARYKTLDVMRRHRTHEELDQALAVADPSENPEATAATRNRDNLLRSCLAKLSPSHREILDLVYYHEEPIEAVAKLIGIPLNTVKTRMFYARRHLAFLLQEAGVDRAAI
jgi:RNA polymerase sigma-70 factor, ECF subfamily